MSILAEINALKAEVNKEVEAIWLNEPIEIKKLRHGYIDSGAGSYGQYFTTFVFADGEVRALGYLCLTTIQTFIGDDDFSLPQIRKAAKNLLTVCGEYLNYSGFQKIWDFVSRFMSILDRAESKEGLYELASALTLYVNRMHGWLHFYFPWSLGAHMKIATAADVAEMRALADGYRPIN